MNAPAPKGPPSLGPSVVSRRKATNEAREGLTRPDGETFQVSDEWYDRAERLTAPIRAARAARLRARGRAVAKAKRTEWRKAGNGARTPRGGLTGNLPTVYPWHAQRANGAERHFENVRTCGDSFRAVLRCRSSDCQGKIVDEIPVGCSSRFFCPKCRAQIAVRFRQEFQASRLGTLWQAGLVGLTKRFRGRDRFSERFITLTVPHVGTPEERVRWIFTAWPAFMRKLNEWTRAHYGASHEIEKTFEDASGKRQTIRLRMHEYEFAQHARFWEWTEGEDGGGHPHFHLWHFGPFVPQALLAEWWTRAWSQASKQTVNENAQGSAVLNVDVRKTDEQSLGRELIKYLTKELAVPLSVLAQVYGALEFRRSRQASKGFFSSWAIPILRICPCCGIVAERQSEETPFTWHVESTTEITTAPARAPPEPALVYTEPEFSLTRLAVETETNSLSVRGLARGLRALVG